jgi:diketogulonate reductase-like aldo/keto reductase
VAEFGIFVCSSCAGIHREMNHKGVKGIGMSNFTDKETETLAQLGNEVDSVLVLMEV